MTASKLKWRNLPGSARAGDVSFFQAQPLESQPVQNTDQLHNQILAQIQSLSETRGQWFRLVHHRKRSSPAQTAQIISLDKRARGLWLARCRSWYMSTAIRKIVLFFKLTRGGLSGLINVGCERKMRKKKRIFNNVYTDLIDFKKKRRKWIQNHT